MAKPPQRSQIVFVLVVLATGLFLIYAYLYYFMLCETGYGLMNAVTLFARAHERLPQDWNEFKGWEYHNTPATDYRNADLESLISLAWGKTAESMKATDHLVFVKDWKRRRFERGWNRYLVGNMMAIDMHGAKKLPAPSPQDQGEPTEHK